MASDRYAVHQLGDEGFTPPRLRLGIEAFGVTVRPAGPGEQIVAEHSEEGEDGNEELQRSRLDPRRSAVPGSVGLAGRHQLAARPAQERNDPHATIPPPDGGCGPPGSTDATELG
ncbi:MAG TPA: hypothetical protein VFW14_11975 [Gaiellales bacterium]|nr:hypothetical protein [Gaiellales bacterium]